MIGSPMEGSLPLKVFQHRISFRIFNHKLKSWQVSICSSNYHSCVPIIIPNVHIGVGDQVPDNLGLVEEERKHQRSIPIIISLIDQVLLLGTDAFYHLKFVLLDSIVKYGLTFVLQWSSFLNQPLQLKNLIFPDGLP